MIFHGIRWIPHCSTGTGGTSGRQELEGTGTEQSRNELGAAHSGSCWDRLGALQQEATLQKALQLSPGQFSLQLFLKECPTGTGASRRGSHGTLGLWRGQGGTACLGWDRRDRRDSHPQLWALLPGTGAHNPFPKWYSGCQIKAGEQQLPEWPQSHGKGAAPFSWHHSPVLPSSPSHGGKSFSPASAGFTWGLTAVCLGLLLSGFYWQSGEAENPQAAETSTRAVPFHPSQQGWVTMDRGHRGCPSPQAAAGAEPCSVGHIPGCVCTVPLTLAQHSLW